MANTATSGPSAPSPTSAAPAAAAAPAIVKVGSASAKASSFEAPRAAAEKPVAPMDALVDFLANGSRTASREFAGGKRFGSLEAAQLAGLSTLGAFGYAAANLIGPVASAARHANNNTDEPREARETRRRRAANAAGLSRMYLTAASISLVDTLNDAQPAALDAAAPAPAPRGLLSGMTFAAAAASALLPNVDMRRWLSSMTAPQVPVVKRMEQSLGINIPDQWEAKGNQLMRDFGGSSFGQWLTGGTWGSRAMLGVMSFMLLDGVKDRIIGDDTVSNTVTLGVSVLAAQMLPDLLKSLMDDPANDDRAPAPQALDFAMSNPGMSFAP